MSLDVRSWVSKEFAMTRIALPEGISVHCIVDDFLWPWDGSTPVLIMHGFARNATFWNRWVPAVAETHRVYRPDLLGCGLSDQPPNGYRYTPETIGAQILAVLDGLSLSKVHWVGESSGGIIGLLLAAAHPDRIASLVLCNTPTRIPDHIKRTYALGYASASEAMRASGVGAWCRQTLGNRLDLAHGSDALCDWVVGEMDRTPPEVAAAMHDCFEGVDVSPPVARHQGAGPAAQRRQQPDRLGTTEGACRDPAERPGRAVCRLRPRRQPAATGALLACGPGILGIYSLAARGDLTPGEVRQYEADDELSEARPHRSRRVSDLPRLHELLRQ
jgi:pimeloyl-ACP methyl ester carboxylesterase